MSVVGPRPESPRYVDPQSAEWQTVLNWRPGITDLATLVYRNEEDLLGASAAPEEYYRQRILPDKLRLNLEYLAARSFWLDLRLILLTLRYSFWPSGFDALHVKRALSCKGER